MNGTVSTPNPQQGVTNDHSCPERGCKLGLETPFRPLGSGKTANEKDCRLMTSGAFEIWYKLVTDDHISVK